MMSVVLQLCASKFLDTWIINPSWIFSSLVRTTKTLLRNFAKGFSIFLKNDIIKNIPGSENSKTIMFYYVYLLESQNGNLYIGYTKDLKKRFKEHNRRLNFSTKSFTPWHLIFYEAYLNEEDAKRREEYLKTSQGSRLLKRMLKEYFYNKNLI